MRSPGYAIAVLSIVVCGCLPGAGGDGDDSQPDPPEEVFPDEWAIEDHMSTSAFLMSEDGVPSMPHGFPPFAVAGMPHGQCIASARMTFDGETDRFTFEVVEGRVGAESCNTAELERNSQRTTLQHDLDGNGACFDIDLIYQANGYQGRGDLDADGERLRLEIYLNGRARNMRCADGPVGTEGVMVDNQPFDPSNAIQVYRRTSAD